MSLGRWEGHEFVSSKLIGILSVCAHRDRRGP